MGEKCFNLRNAHVLGMAFVVEKDMTTNPLDVGLFGAIGVVLETNEFANLVKQFLGSGFHGGFIEKNHETLTCMKLYKGRLTLWQSDYTEMSPRNLLRRMLCGQMPT
jgi:hypothetical protein